MSWSWNKEIIFFLGFVTSFGERFYGTWILPNVFDPRKEVPKVQDLIPERGTGFFFVQNSCWDEKKHLSLYQIVTFENVPELNELKFYPFNLHVYTRSAISQWEVTIKY